MRIIKKNSIFRTIYKSNNQITENRINIKYKPITKELQGIRKLQLISEKKEIKKQTKLTKREATKLEVVEKKRLKKK